MSSGGEALPSQAEGADDEQEDASRNGIAGSTGTRARGATNELGFERAQFLVGQAGELAGAAELGLHREAMCPPRERELDRQLRRRRRIEVAGLQKTLAAQDRAAKDWREDGHRRSWW